MDEKNEFGKKKEKKHLILAGAHFTTTFGEGDLLLTPYPYSYRLDPTLKDIFLF